MKKKWIGGILACALAASSLFGAVACKEAGGTGGGNQNNQGGGENQGGTGGSTVIEPGTVITDRTLIDGVFESLSNAELSGITYSAGVNLSLTEGQQTISQTISAEGAARFGESVSADLFASISGGDTQSNVSEYLLFFLRDGTAYTAGGDNEGGKETDFDALKAQLKASEDPIVLDRDEDILPEPFAGSSVVMQVVQNMPALCSGVLTKTEGGYALSFDLIGAAKSLLEGAEGVLGAIEQTADMTLTALFGQKFVSDTLGTLLNGITAQEIRALVTGLVPSLAEALPAAAEKATALSYVEGLLRSGSFYSALTGEEEGWQEYQTFGEVPISAIAGLIAGEEVDFAELGLKDTLKAWREGLEEKIVSLLLDVMDLSGEISEESAEIKAEFSFDEDKKLLGFSLDALVESNVTENAAESQEAEQSPAEPKKKAMRAAVKLETTCAASPELFDLTGCRYSGTDGDVTIGAK